MKFWFRRRWWEGKKTWKQKGRVWGCYCHEKEDKACLMVCLSVRLFKIGKKLVQLSHTESVGAAKHA